MKTHSAFALAIAAALAAPLAFAQDKDKSATQDLPPPLPEKSQGGVHAQAHSMAATRTTFAEFDLDHDGQISIEEAGDDEMLADGFAELDADNDGYVTDTEYRTGMKAQMPQHDDADDDGDQPDED